MAYKFLQNIFHHLAPQNDKIIAGIKRYPLFQDLTENEINAFAQKCYIRHFKTEEEIYSEASPSAAIYFIISGSVGIYKKRRSAVTDRIQVIHAGKFFGDSSLINNDPRKHSTKAMEKSETLVLFKTDFELMEQTRPKLALKFLKIITNKFYNELTIFQTEFHELSQKVAKDELLK